MRCSVCGHESPPGSSFCLNCGSALSAAQTPVAAVGLPVICQACRGENPPGMKFCRNCGTALTATAPAMVAGAPMMAPAGPLPLMTPAPLPPPPPVALGIAPTAVPAPRVASGSTVTCPRCATATPAGFAYCQQCGLHMQAVVPTDPAGSRVRPPSNAPPIAAKPIAGVDPQAATMAQPDSGARPVMRPSSTTQQWGSAVLVNRDGSDGQRFVLTSEDTVVGRTGAEIAFADDRFLATQHARIARSSDGTIRLHPLDTLNGVFKKADGSVELADGATILVGREVLRFEKVAAEERTVTPLVRHGVALFGSPPRDPWGRLIQVVPSGGYRDVRHLAADEIVLGREEGDIVFRDDAFMSRRHAAITWNGQRAQITDLGSSNGTFVRIAAPVVLKHGDHVRMGDQLLRIELGR